MMAQDYHERLSSEIQKSHYHRDLLHELYREDDTIPYAELLFERMDAHPADEPNRDWRRYHQAFCDLDRKGLIETTGISRAEGGLRNVSSDDVHTARASLTNLGERLYRDLLHS